MQSSDLSTITDLDTLRHLILKQASTIATQTHLISTQQQELLTRQTKIDALTFELARLKRWQFGKKSEQLQGVQSELFTQTVEEDIAAVEVQLTQLQNPASLTDASPSAEPIPPAPHRTPLPAHLPRIEVRHDLPSCQCVACGTTLSCIGEEVSEQLDCEPIRFFVRRHIRPKYACRSCQSIKTAALPAQIIDKGLPAPGLLAQVLIAKYADHLPLYRQEAVYARSGVSLSRSTMAGWVGAAGAALMPLVQAMREDLQGQSVLHADETPVQMLDPGAGVTKRAYLWGYRSVEDCTHRCVIFDFQTSRAGEHAQRFLGSFKGALMVDDYAGYKALFAGGKIDELGCWAHVRRKFFELHKANKSMLAHEAIERIGVLYEIERHTKEWEVEKRHRYRQERAVPHLSELHRWLQACRVQVREGSGMAGAIDHALKRWPALIRYVENGGYPLDNNALENAIRPIALGRKNWLFAGSESAGQRAAAVMSLIGTARMNGIDPHAYLKDILMRLPTHPYSRLRELLAYHWQPSHG
jgi:transposase